METKQITSKTLNFIERAISQNLKFFGINVVFHSLEKGDNCYFESTTFQTTPAIHKSNKVIGHSYLDGRVLWIDLNYRFEYFVGGENGTQLGTIKFSIFGEGETQFARCDGLTVNSMMQYDNI